jgi:hypothetical protein
MTVNLSLERKTKGDYDSESKRRAPSPEQPKPRVVCDVQNLERSEPDRAGTKKQKAESRK